MSYLTKLFKKSDSHFSLPDWTPTPNWTKETINLLNEIDVTNLAPVSLDDIIEKSEDFKIKFPTSTNRCEHLKSIVEAAVLTRNINSAYPVIHESVLKLCCDFILLKRNHIHNREERIFLQLNVIDVINRLLSKRAVMCVGAQDEYMLLDGSGGVGHWENVGTHKEEPPLTIENYLSYDELKLSALLSISSYTYFINEGHRGNGAVYQEDRSKVESEGIIIGLIGPRLHKTNAVESQEIVFTKKQNTEENGYGKTIQHSVPKLFADFYEEQCLDHDEMLQKKKSDTTGRYVRLLGDENIFDNQFYYKRLTISIDTLLGEANSRGKFASKFTYVHVVGIGLGFWKVSPHQDRIFMDTFLKRITCLGNKLRYISDICFAYMTEKKCGRYRNGEVVPIKGHPNRGIKIHICNRQPNGKLTDEHEDKLLVVSYAWNGNALPGNDFWKGHLGSSSDPAAACSTQIAELHNPHINPLVCAANLRIVTEGEVVTLQEYRQRSYAKIGLNKLFKKSEPDSLLPDWTPTPNWTEQTINLLNDAHVPNLPAVSLDDIIEKSDNFSLKFPTTANRCNHLKSVVEENVLNRNINSTYPVIHEKVLKLCCEFILFKRNHGTTKEQDFYKNLSVTDIINRLLSKRAATFVGSLDKYKLLDGKTGLGHWEDIGTPAEKTPLTIDNYLSYDELKLSALLSVSSFTYFINEGHRMNRAVYQEDRNKVQEEGIIIGLIGPRLHKTNAVENQEIVLSKKQNTEENGYGKTIQHSIPKLFADFYEEQCLNYNEMLKKKTSDTSGRYILLFGHENIFDNHFYFKRLTISIDTLLGEANSRGKTAKKCTYIHMVGIGLGVWKVSSHQDKTFMDTFFKRITCLGDKLHHISDICFAYMTETKCGPYESGEVVPIEGHPNGGIKIYICNRNPHEKLVDEDKDKLLVVSYAWDGNALPGNEFWFGSLATSSDPAAACSTQVAELHNPHINPLVSAANLRIVTEGDVVTLQEYKQKVKLKI